MQREFWEEGGRGAARASEAVQVKAKYEGLESPTVARSGAASTNGTALRGAERLGES